MIAFWLKILKVEKEDFDFHVSFYCLLADLFFKMR